MEVSKVAIAESEIKLMITKARLVRENAFVPTSQHGVGACVLTGDGGLFEGCNVESSISGLGICAERAAVDHAIAHGKYQFKAILTFDEEIILPCGVCLQYLLEFSQVSGEDIAIIAADFQGKQQINWLRELLPHGFLAQRNLEKISAYRNR